MRQQRAESLPLKRHQILFGHQTAGIDIATADYVGDQRCDVKVVLADEAAVAHVDQRALDGRNATAPGHRKGPAVRRAVARVEHRHRFVDGHIKQLVLVRHDDVAVQQVAQLARLDGAGAHLGHGGCGEAFDQAFQNVLVGGAGGVLGSTPRNVGQATRAGHQAHAHLNQAHVAFHGGHAARRINRHLAAAAQGQAAHG